MLLTQASVICACSSFLVVFLHLITCCAGREVVSGAFNVIPGGAKLSHSEKWEDITCQFTYVCQGGTSEEWVIVIRAESDGTYVCEVNRPEEVSYLFFQEFQVEIHGATILDGLMFGPNHETLGKPDEFIVDTQRQKVSSAAGFKNSLNRVMVVLKKKSRHEL